MCLNCHQIESIFGYGIMSGSRSIFRDMFGEECVDFSDDKNISVTVDGKAIHICLETRVRNETKRHIWRKIGCCCFVFLSFFV